MLNSKAHVKEDPRHWIFDTDENKVVEIKSGLVLKPGEQIKTNDSGEIINAEIENDSNALEQFKTNAANSAKEFQSGETYSTGNAKIDHATKSMWKRLELCSSLLIRKLVTASPIIVRFHNDADGSSGAYGLYKSLEDLSKRRKELGYKFNITWIMQQSVSYSVYDASNDIMIANSYDPLEKPLLIMIDFGTSMESNNGLEQVKDRFNIIWLDHHPLVEGFKGLSLDTYVNPWNFGSDSNYTAGFLACVFSKTFSSRDTKEIENASLTGDCSIHAIPDMPGAELSLLLDLITSDAKVAFGSASTNITPYEIEKLLANKEKKEELIGFAKMRLSEVTDAALKALKHYKTNSAIIYTLNFEGIRDEQSKYPLPGRFSSKLLDKIVELKKEPCIVIVHSGRYISIRVSRELSEKVSLSKVIESIKESYAEVIEAGGGHMLASGIKLTDKVEKTKVVKEVISLLKKQLGGADEADRQIKPSRSSRQQNQ